MKNLHNVFLIFFIVNISLFYINVYLFIMFTFFLWMHVCKFKIPDNVYQYYLLLTFGFVYTITVWCLPNVSWHVIGHFHIIDATSIRQVTYSVFLHVLMLITSSQKQKKSKMWSVQFLGKNFTILDDKVMYKKHLNS